MISCVLVGLGRAGAMYPPGIAPDSQVPVVRNHLDALLQTPGISGLVLVDTDQSAREGGLDRAKGRISATALHTLDGRPDIIADVGIVATPPVERMGVISQLINAGVRVIIVEKPLATSVNEARHIVRMANDAGVTLRVNFNRRFDASFGTFRKALPGRPLSVSAFFGKGLRNYASHLVDLVTDWFGPVVDVQALGTNRRTNGHEGDDTSISFRLGLRDNLDMVATGVDGIGYDQFEVTMHYPTARYELVNGGAEKVRRESRDGLYYRDYVQLEPGILTEPPMPVGGYTELYEFIVRHLQHGEALPGCTGQDAVMNVSIIDMIEESARSGGKTMPIQSYESNGDGIP